MEQLRHWLRREGYRVLVAPLSIMLLTFFAGWYVNSRVADERLSLQQQQCDAHLRQLQHEVEELRQLQGDPQLEGVTRAEFERITVRLEAELTDLSAELRRHQRADNRRR